MIMPQIKAITRLAVNVVKSIDIMKRFRRSCGITSVPFSLRGDPFYRIPSGLPALQGNRLHGFNPERIFRDPLPEQIKAADRIQKPPGQMNRGLDFHHPFAIPDRERIIIIAAEPPAVLRCVTYILVERNPQPAAEPVIISLPVVTDH